MSPRPAGAVGLFEVDVGALALAPILAARSLRTGWIPRSPAARRALRPVAPTREASAAALPVAIRATLPTADTGAPRVGLLTVLAVLVASLLLCATPDEAQPHRLRQRPRTDSRPGRV